LSFWFVGLDVLQSLPGGKRVLANADGVSENKKGGTTCARRKFSL